MASYNEIVPAIFIERPNRFIAKVEINGGEETVHVKNTGRCREILIKGTKVFLEKSNNPNRKTKYSLISAYKGDELINIDSQVPNKVVEEAIKAGKIKELGFVDYLKREQTYKASRFDIYFEKGEEKGFIEVKGVTLEGQKICRFPDAPTERGRKHILEMIDAVEEGYKGYLFFLIQLENVQSFTPNVITDPKFAEALKKAKNKGVEILVYNTTVSQNTIEIKESIPYEL